jgi:ATP-binding cassette subfamily F protein 3
MIRSWSCATCSFSELDGQRTLDELLDALFVEVHAIEAELQQLEAALQQEPDSTVMES